MALEKLEIQQEIAKDTFEHLLTVPFNPKQLSFSTRTRWQPTKTKRKTPDKQFTGGDGTSLSIELFFDAYEKPGTVKDPIDRLRKLTEVNKKLNRPPKCLLFWGRFGAAEGRLFTGILESIQETYTLFLSNGTPVRATVQCSFAESIDKKEVAGARPAIAETSTVIPNASQTLSSVAADKYGDPAAWRKIAAANGIDDPLDLKPGITLVIPPLPGGLG